jgi:hypothetical protein
MSSIASHSSSSLSIPRAGIGAQTVLSPIGNKVNVMPVNVMPVNVSKKQCKIRLYKNVYMLYDDEKFQKECKMINSLDEKSRREAKIMMVISYCKKFAEATLEHEKLKWYIDAINRIIAVCRVNADTLSNLLEEFVEGIKTSTIIMNVVNNFEMLSIIAKEHGFYDKIITSPFYKRVITAYESLLTNETTPKLVNGDRTKFFDCNDLLEWINHANDERRDDRYDYNCKEFQQLIDHVLELREILAEDIKEVTLYKKTSNLSINEFVKPNIDESDKIEYPVYGKCMILLDKSDINKINEMKAEERSIWCMNACMSILGITEDHTKLKWYNGAISSLQDSITQLHKAIYVAEFMKANIAVSDMMDKFKMGLNFANKAEKIGKTLDSVKVLLNENGFSDELTKSTSYNALIAEYTTLLIDNTIPQMSNEFDTFYQMYEWIDENIHAIKIDSDVKTLIRKILNPSL